MELHLGVGFSCLPEKMQALVMGFGAGTSLVVPY